MPAQVLLSLGSNAGERREALRGAARRIAQLPDTRLRACSCCYETDGTTVNVLLPIGNNRSGFSTCTDQVVADNISPALRYAKCL